MQRVVLYESSLGPSAARRLPEELFREPVRELYLQMLAIPDRRGPVMPLIPQSVPGGPIPVCSYPPGGLFASLMNGGEAADRSGLVLFNGRYLRHYDHTALLESAARFDWDVLSVQITPSLAGGVERVRLASDRRVVGFRRLYEPGIEPATPSQDWPPVLLINASTAAALKEASPIFTYADFLTELCRQKRRVRHIRFGGQIRDLCEEEGWFAFLERSGGMAPSPSFAANLEGQGVRIVGRVHIGRNVRLGRGSVLVGPAILSDGVEVGEDSFLHNVWAGGGTRLAPESRCRNCVLFPNHSAPSETLKTPPLREQGCAERRRDRSPFRTWPFFSYPVLGKRIFDLFTAGVVLLLFLPFLLLIALVVKLTSRGPVFYAARRQGLHGKEFDCLKFRTMMVQAEAIQEKLRIANQVDGPQFKIEDDPRITRIGKFLRDTSIDEIPQFFNVLMGQMSVVGPRPSPESENETCPYWRDARLSVRPGITGLWQVMRTRQVSMDFQEWIYYDTNYVRRISFGLDLLICLKTARKLINSFLDQFG